MVTRKTRGAKTTGSAILLFALHQVVSTLGVGVSVPFLAFSAVPAVQYLMHWQITTRQVHAALTETPGFPLQVIFGFVLGAQISYRFRQTYGQWVWILPTVLLAGALVWLPVSALDNALVAKAEYFFGHGCQPRFHCFYQIVITLPAMAAASYSLGTFVGLRIPNQPSKAP
jgi:hypothetical protein